MEKRRAETPKREGPMTNKKQCNANTNRGGAGAALTLGGEATNQNDETK